ncbi:MAG: response regulator, partial [Calditrichota bacterium]
MRLLIVEDEIRLANFLKQGFKEQSYVVDITHDGEEGEYLACTNDYDLIILDVLLPKQNGWEVCEKIRAAGVEVPVIMLTALDEVSNRVKGLESGADDYVTKPFEFAE